MHFHGIRNRRNVRIYENRNIENIFHVYGYITIYEKARRNRKVVVFAPSEKRDTLGMNVL